VPTVPNEYQALITQQPEGKVINMIPVNTKAVERSYIYLI